MHAESVLEGGINVLPQSYWNVQCESTVRLFYAAKTECKKSAKKTIISN
ncbi:hypothetical protein CPter91_4245 [Collimonas pratensis]|uniref:Uncharacterized protein n=1 Tax=Collimonas pratensis TaxID=279113 RepID=A0A127Q903_9BURK|nr:hypothetical protein CPter91_4245 [Collimonas pratensis]